jgi:hypothetical protein
MPPLSTISYPRQLKVAQLIELLYQLQPDDTLVSTGEGIHVWRDADWVSRVELDYVHPAIVKGSREARVVLFQL